MSSAFFGVSGQGDITLLSGQKTFLRPFEEEDLNSLYLWFNDQEVNYWANGAWPLSTMLNLEVLGELFLSSNQPAFTMQNEYRYAILNEEKGIIGYTGYREINVPARSATLFISIGDKAYWGKGYGSDALLTLVRYLFTQWNFHRLHLDTWDGNLRAIKAYQKLGFQIEGQLREARYVCGEYRDALLFGLLQKEFYSAHPELFPNEGLQKDN